MKTLLVIVGVLIVLAGGMYAFREPLLAAVSERLTADMFVPKDEDAYDVGVAIGTKFPDIRARVDGAEVTSLTQFTGERGVVIVANRSVDW